MIELSRLKGQPIDYIRSVLKFKLRQGLLQKEHRMVRFAAALLL
ncbi:hypothetical protein [Desulforamulus ruminis]|nr:hypothetical protein [Desulforamulus ruminis]